MMNLPLGLVIEGLVALLLLITIGYCMLLNSRLKRLRADEEGLRATIGELLTATEIAERAIQGLRTTSAECNASLGARLEEAEQVSDALSGKLNAADAVMQRIGKVASASGLAQEKETPSVHPVAPARPLNPAQTHGGVAAPATPAPNANHRLDDAARALQSRLARIAS
jgi:hypothetical protein